MIVSAIPPYIPDPHTHDSERRCAEKKAYKTRSQSDWR